MKPESIEIVEGIKLHTIKTDKFKTDLVRNFYYSSTRKKKCYD